jgi:release factor glutamine methyltransferase
VKPPRTDRPDGASFYPPREDTALLLPFARVPPGTDVLEIGTGSGVLALAAARSGGRVVATDLHRPALLRLRRLAAAESLPVTPVRTDLARGLGSFDRILANPPYLPTLPSERDPDPGHNLALDGGPDGLAVTRPLVRALPDHLRAGGHAYLVVSSLQDADRLARLRTGWAVHGRVDDVDERRFEGETLTVWRLARTARPPPWTRGASPRR